MVVSCPAKSSRMQVATSSSSDRRSPASSSATSSLSRSRCGDARRAVMSSRNRSAISRVAAPARWYFSGASRALPINSAISSDRRFRRGELLARRTEHVHDDQRRQRHGEVGDEIEFFLAQPSESSSHAVRRLDVGPQSVDRAHVENLGREPAQARVLRRVAEHHPQREVAHQLGDLAPPRSAAAWRRTDAGGPTTCCCPGTRASRLRSASGPRP